VTGVQTCALPISALAHEADGAGHIAAQKNDGHDRRQARRADDADMGDGDGPSLSAAAPDSELTAKGRDGSRIVDQSGKGRLQRPLPRGRSGGAAGAASKLGDGAPQGRDRSPRGGRHGPVGRGGPTPRPPAAPARAQQHSERAAPSPDPTGPTRGKPLGSSGGTSPDRQPHRSPRRGKGKGEAPMSGARAYVTQDNATARRMELSPIDIPVPAGPETSGPPAPDLGRKVSHRDRLREDQPADEQNGRDARAPGGAPKCRRRNPPSGEDSRVECPECGVAWPIRARPRDMRCPDCSCLVHEFMGMQARTPSPSDGDARGPSTPHKKGPPTRGATRTIAPGAAQGSRSTSMGMPRARSPHPRVPLSAPSPPLCEGQRGESAAREKGQERHGKRQGGGRPHRCGQDPQSKAPWTSLPR